MISMSENTHHIRSTSMPTRMHPLTLRVEEQLQKLRGWDGPSSSSALPTMAMLCGGLTQLSILYANIEDMLQLSQSQRSILHHGHEKLADEMLNGSLNILDVCGTTRDVLMEMKEHVKDIQSALRRRSGEKDFGNKVGLYISSKKKMKKELDKSLRSLKRTESKNVQSPILDNDQYLANIIRMVREVRAVTIAIFESLLCSMSSPKPMAKMSSISKWMGKVRVACESEAKKRSHMEWVDASLLSLTGYKSCRSVEIEFVHSTQKELETIVASILGLEDGLDCLFRSMIRARVSLLNVLCT